VQKNKIKKLEIAWLENHMKWLFAIKLGFILMAGLSSCCYAPIDELPQNIPG